MQTVIAFLTIIAAVSSIDTSNISRKEMFCLATAVYHEARGEDITGRSAVAHVILNRKRSRHYPDTVCEVIYQPYQFSYIHEVSPDYKSTAWRDAVEVAAFARTGITNDPTGGAMNYYAHGIVTPYWASGAIVTASIGGHTFLTIPR